MHDRRGSGPPVVLLHGLASTHRWWDLVIRRLPRRRVLCWDHRGHGQSAVTGGYRVEALAEDAAAVLDQRGLHGCVVAGHSMGAAVALQLAVRRPDLVSGVCCVEGGLPDPRILFGDHWNTAHAVMRNDRRTEPTASTLAAWARGAGLPEAALPAVLANYQPAREPGRLRLRLDRGAETGLAYSLWCQQPATLLAAINAPVTAVMARPKHSGQLHRLQAALCSTMTRSGRQVRVVWLDGGHHLPLQHPARIAGIIKDLADRAQSGS
ncbi:alpha/beta fold hydrolase [Dactylosporangium sp. CA-139066]|uniref:alpha/beta fold hydrolase n=1 Tax=Dactylosporangium sp. CA-139066 TaxID=3239930 RepID=UPI003D8D9970